MLCPRYAAPFLLVLLSVGAPTTLHAQATPLRQIVDAEIEVVWKREKVAPVGAADDASFLRRIYIDLVGTIPTIDEATRFLNDTDAKKREKLIDKLLADPRYATHQANVWNLVLFGRRPANLENDRKREGFKKWLTGQFEKNDPYDRSVRELLLAEQEGTETFYVQFRAQPAEAAVAVSRLFLGTQLQCARCHDHPFENWTQRDFFGMAGFFVRLVVLDTGNAKKKYTIAEKSTGEVLFTGAVKDQKPGQKGEPIKPKFLGGPVLDEPPTPKDYKDPPQGAKTYAQAALLAQGEAGRVGGGAGEPVLRAGGGQPRLGAVHGPRFGASGRRPRREERGRQRAPCSRLGETAGGPQIRPEMVHPRTGQQRDVPTRRAGPLTEALPK